MKFREHTNNLKRRYFIATQSFHSLGSVVPRTNAACLFEIHQETIVFSRDKQKKKRLQYSIVGTRIWNLVCVFVAVYKWTRNRLTNSVNVFVCERGDGREKYLNNKNLNNGIGSVRFLWIILRIIGAFRPRPWRSDIGNGVWDTPPRAQGSSKTLWIGSKPAGRACRPRAGLQAGIHHFRDVRPLHRAITYFFNPFIFILVYKRTCVFGVFFFFFAWTASNMAFYASKQKNKQNKGKIDDVFHVLPLPAIVTIVVRFIKSEKNPKPNVIEHQFEMWFICMSVKRFKKKNLSFRNNIKKSINYWSFLNVLKRLKYVEINIMIYFQVSAIVTFVFLMPKYYTQSQIRQH